MVLIWPSQIIDQMVYLDHMGEYGFLKTLNIFLSEITTLITLIFCVALSSMPFFGQIMPMGPQIVPPLGSHVFHRPRVGLQIVIVLFPDHIHLLFSSPVT